MVEEPEYKYKIKVGKKFATATPAGELTPIEFAVGVVNNEAYVGYWEDIELYDDHGNFINVDTVPVLVFKDKRILYNNENLREYKLKRDTTPAVQENWWSGKIVDVEPKSYYEEVFNTFKYYVDASENSLHIMTLWTIGTIFHPLFNAYAYLYVGGVKRSGKTKVLTLIKLIGFNGIRSHSMSEATIYRLVESGKATLLLDEQDYLINPERRAELRTLMLGGYKKGSFVYRSEKTSKGKILPTRFKIYSAKALANIEGLDDVLLDRTIMITMMRSVDPKITRRDPDENDPKWVAMRDKLASLFINYHTEVSNMYNTVLKALGDEPDYSGIPENLKQAFEKANEFIYARVREIWCPILALALFFENHGVTGLIEKVIQFAKDNVTEKEAEEAETPEVGLVIALCKVYDGNRYYPLSDIVSKYREVTEIEKIRPESVGRMLKRLGFKDKVRRAGGMYYYIGEPKLLDVCKRLNINPETFTVSEKLSRVNPTTQQAGALPENLITKAYEWCKKMKDFTVEELAFALFIDDKTATRIVDVLVRDKKVFIMPNGRYSVA